MMVIDKVIRGIGFKNEVKAEVKCGNPRCITSIEHTAPKLFYVSNKVKGEYRCGYCDQVHTA